MNIDRSTTQKENTPASGSLKISTDVIASIAQIAAREVKGVAYVSDIVSNSIQTAKNDTRSLMHPLKVKLKGNTLDIELSVILRHGAKIPDVYKDLQHSLKNAVEGMTGLTVRNIDIYFVGIEEEEPQERS
ncbi:MAG: Asp23/Gls24 family envelope stress response protein [Oscillospiraceae bacterium]|jgi:uncharacterized alkaline shock family protein YloU